MAVTLPTFADNLQHPNWDQRITAAVPQLLEGVVEFGKYAKPTAQLFWDNKQYVEVDTDKRFRINWSYGGADVHYGTPGTMSFNTEIKDSLSTMIASPAVMYGATSVNDFDLKIYANSLHDLVADRTFRMNQGLTEANNYETWAKTGYTTSEGTGTEIDIDSVITSGINSVKIKNKPAVGSRLLSIPYFIRPHVYGHTLQNLSSSDNNFWRSHIYLAKGSTGGEPTPVDANLSSVSGHSGSLAALVTQASDSDAAENDMLKSSMSALADLEFPTLGDIDFMLEKMQEGNALQIVVACPPAAYNYLARDFFGATLGQSAANQRPRAMDSQNPLTDMGLNFTGSAFQHSGYGAIFYSDPTLATTWPNALWFFDMDSLFIACVNDFGPKIYPWHHLPNSTVDVMAKLLWCQRIVKDRKATGALLNCKFR